LVTCQRRRASISCSSRQSALSALGPVTVTPALDALTTDEPLAAIAARTGFADQAHMTRTLRREIDLSPAAARRLLRHPVDQR
jgi:hypothetical protein